MTQTQEFSKGDRFYGDDYNHERDFKRLSGQLLKIWNVVKDNQWHTLREISGITGAPEASVSAGLRALRNKERGGHIIERKYVDKGLYKYRLAPPQPDPVKQPNPLESMSSYERARLQLSKTGHGHVVERLDGTKQACGGLALCKICKQEKAYLESLQGK